MKTAGLRGCLVSGLLVLSACGDPGQSSLPGAQSASTDASRVESAADPARVKVVPRTVSVTLTEGTNMAVAVHPASGDRVISLQGTLFLLPADNSEPVALTDGYYDAREPQWSPDGQRVLFQGYRNGNWDLWQVGRDGQPPQALTADAFDDREPQYSADGEQVVFSSDRSGRYDIWQMNLADGGLNQLTRSNTNAYAPSVAADGRLAYTEEGAQGRARLMMQDTEGSDALLVEEVGVISGVQWSPDASAVGYHVLGPAGAQLKLATVATRETRVLSRDGADVFPFKPAWLGPGQLAYTADGQIFKRDVQAGSTRQAWPFAVTVALTRHDYPRRQRDYATDVQRRALGINSPVVSNDGGHVYFLALGDVWHWQPAIGQLQQLTDDPWAESSPALSPDGSTLAFAVERGMVLHLVLLNIATGEQTEPGVSAAQLTNLAWSADGEQLGFFVDVPGNPLGGQLTLLEVSSGALTQILEPMPAQPVSFSGDGRKVAVARLNPYSSRYREGVYELVVADIATQTTQVVAPEAHRSLLNGTLSPDGAMTYIEGGVLHRLELDENFQALEKVGPITQGLTDMPSFSANGAHLVYLSGASLQQQNMRTDERIDITPNLTYALDAPDERYVLRGARLFTGEGQDYVLGHDVWVQGNRIERIVAAGQIATDDSVRVIDVAGKTIVPGLFEMHAHMGQVSETQGRIWLSYGVTTVRDPGSSPYVAKERQEAWDSGRRVGPRSHITGYLTDGNRVYYSMAEGIVSQAHLQMALARTEQLQLDFVKTYVRLPDHWQKTVVDFAHGIGIPVSSHELYPAVAHGMDHVEHIGGTSRRGYQPKVSRLGYAYDDVVQLLSASGMGMTATAVLPGFAVIVEQEPDWFETPQFDHFYGPRARAGYEMMLRRFGGGAAQIAAANGRLLKALTEADALLVTGTDSPFVPYGAGLHAEFRLYARAGIQPADIIRQATLKSAQAAGVAAELGTLAAGKLADMVVVDGDPLSRIGDLDNVVMTIKNGRRYPLASLLTDEG